MRLIDAKSHLKRPRVFVVTVSLATLPFRRLRQNFLKPGDFDDIQSGGLLSA